MALIFFHPTLTPTPTPAYSSPLNNKTLIISSSCKPHFHFSPKSLFFCPKFTCRDATITNPNSETPVDSDWINADHERLVLESPWEGAITYKRNASITHVEYCTTLERLGLGTFSTGVSKTRSSAMGIRVTKGVKDYPLGTPVQVSIDVIRRKHRLRLDGIVRTVLTLGCNRCGEPAADCVYSNFSFVLNEEPLEEPDVINMGVIFGEEKSKSYNTSSQEGDDDTDVDFDDWLYFPSEQKQIDISKNIRDIVHLEITINTVCNSECRGLCLNCGVNLNTSSCNCSEQDVVKENSYGSWGNLKSQIQQK